MVQPRNGMLFSLKREGNSDIHMTIWMNPENVITKWNKPDTKRQIFCDSTYMKEPRTEAEIIMVIRGWEERLTGELLCTVSKSFSLEDENTLDMDGGNGCTKTWIYWTPLNCTIKTVPYGVHTLPLEKEREREKGEGKRKRKRCPSQGSLSSK